jgi:hypothetical protein
MELEYTLIDCSTGLIYGPYETFNRAREHAEDFEQWEITNAEEGLVDWSPTPERGDGAEVEARRRRGKRGSAEAIEWLATAGPEQSVEAEAMLLNPAST